MALSQRQGQTQSTRGNQGQTPDAAHSTVTAQIKTRQAEQGRRPPFQEPLQTKGRPLHALDVAGSDGGQREREVEAPHCPPTEGWTNNTNPVRAGGRLALKQRRRRHRWDECWKPLRDGSGHECPQSVTSCSREISRTGELRTESGLMVAYSGAETDTGREWG